MANGKYALGICDRSGQIYKLRDLVFEITNGRRNGLRVGRDMVITHKIMSVELDRTMNSQYLTQDQM